MLFHVELEQHCIGLDNGAPHAESQLVTQIVEQAPVENAPHPVLIFGSNPPNLTALAAFEEEHSALSRDLPEAIDGWDTRNSSMNFVAEIGLVTAVLSTAIALFKTDTAIAGATAAIEEAELQGILLRALEAKGYANTAPEMALIDTGALVKTLLSTPIKSPKRSELTTLYKAYEEAKLRYEMQYKPELLAAGGKWDAIPDRPAAILGAALGNLVTRFETLRDLLLADTGGVPTAYVISEQKQLKEGNRSSHPLIYITHHDAALTTTTKKNISTGWREVPARMAGAATIDYVVVGRNGAKRGSIDCIIPRVNFESVMTFAASDAAICQQTKATVSANQTDRASTGGSKAVAGDGPARTPEQ